MKTTIENILNAAKLMKASAFSPTGGLLGYRVIEWANGRTVIQWYNPCAHGYECPCDSGYAKNVAAIKVAIWADGRFEITEDTYDWVVVRERDQS